MHYVCSTAARTYMYMYVPGICAPLFLCNVVCLHYSSTYMPSTYVFLPVLNTYMYVPSTYPYSYVPSTYPYSSVTQYQC